MRHPLTSLLAAALILAGCSSDEGGGGKVDIGEATPAPEGVEGVLAYEVTDNSHVSGSVDYSISPPVGGPHDPAWANCGFYDDEVPNENAVHSLEHGAVWITYDDETAVDMSVLADLAAASDHVLVSRFPGLDSPLVLTAWNRQLAVDSTDDQRIEDFLQAYVDGPTAPEAAASCSGGVG